MTEQMTGTRLPALDIARGIAILCMASYHFSWDLEFFHYLDPGTVGTGFFKIYARMIASSFLFMAGFSLVLSHSDRILWKKFGRRFVILACAAALVSLVTWFAMPEGFIFFGILHEIAFASLLGLAFLNVPVPLVLITAIAAVVAPVYLRTELFDAPYLWWVGLSQTLPHSNDYVPVLPWTGPFLFGMAACKIAKRFNILERGGALTIPPVRLWSILSQAGRHSLVIYLLHQPLLFGLVWVIAQIAPAPLPDPSIGYMRNCVAQCSGQETADICERFCTCTLTKLKESNVLTQLQAGTIDPRKDEGISQISEMCTMAAMEPESQQ